MGHKTNNMIWVCLKMVYTPLAGGSEHDLYFSLLYFSIYWEAHNPNWRTPSFFRGLGLNHQPEMVYTPKLQNRAGKTIN
jgi:hypothetical protein